MPAIDVLFDDLLERCGSDLHLAVDQPPLARIGAELVTLNARPMSAKELEGMLLELVTPTQRARLAADLDIEFSLSYKDLAHFRASYYSKHPQIAAAFRVVPIRAPTLADLGSPEVIRRLAEGRAGLVLVGGPSSSGKTTTSAAVVDHINKTRACHVLTIESPIEFVHESHRAQITQREVGVHVPTRAAALKAAARENPDVVYVSELSSADDIEYALRLASDGVLVVSTFQASGVATTLDRLVTAFPVESQPRMRRLAADCIAGIVVQHLVPSADSKRRIAVHEFFVSDSSIAVLIRQGKVDALLEAMRSGAGPEMQALDAALERLVDEGKISPEVAFARSIDKAAFAEVVARVKRESIANS